MKLPISPSLEQTIRRVRADIKILIDDRANAVAQGSPGVPIGVIRNMLTARAPACPCEQYLELFGDGKN
jgi:hypothetical protein